MTKLVMVSPGIGPYGGWNMFFRLLKYYQSSQKFKRNISITIITTGATDHRLNELTSLNLNMYRTNWLNYNKNVHIIEKYPSLNLANSLPLLIITLLYMCVRGRKIQRVLSNGLLSSLPCILFKKITKNEVIKIYPWLHTDYRFSEKRSLKWLVRHSLPLIDKLFVNSLDIKGDLMKCGISDDKIIVINNWIDDIGLSDDEKIRLNEKYTFLNDYEFIVLYLGRYVEYKHFNTYLKVAQITASSKIGFVFIGDGVLIDNLKKVQCNNKHVYSFNNLPDKDVRYLLSRANITMTYADEYYLGLTAYESLFSGTPVLYIWFSAAPDKYSRKIRISKNILPPQLGYEVSDDINDISSFILSLKENRFPSALVREKCINYALKFHSERNADELASHLFQS
jgi:glycosyltransferase involved in cell wall biosynthesis